MSHIHIYNFSTAAWPSAVIFTQHIMPWITQRLMFPALICTVWSGYWKQKTAPGAWLLAQLWVIALSTPHLQMWSTSWCCDRITNTVFGSCWNLLSMRHTRAVYRPPPELSHWRKHTVCSYFAVNLAAFPRQWGEEECAPPSDRFSRPLLSETVDRCRHLIHCTSVSVFTWPGKQRWWGAAGLKQMFNVWGQCIS